jgi:hypothetical protein
MRRAGTVASRYAKSISEQLAPYTRDAPITRPEVYEDAERRMRTQAEGRGEASARRELEHALLVGTDVVYLRGDYLQVGQVAFRIGEVREYARSAWGAGSSRCSSEVTAVAEASHAPRPPECYVPFTSPATRPAPRSRR